MDAVQYMLHYFQLDGLLDKETAMSLAYCAYFYAIAEGGMGTMFE